MVIRIFSQQMCFIELVFEWSQESSTLLGEVFVDSDGNTKTLIKPKSAVQLSCSDRRYTNSRPIILDVIPEGPDVAFVCLSAFRLNGTKVDN